MIVIILDGYNLCPEFATGPSSHCPLVSCLWRIEKSEGRPWVLVPAPSRLSAIAVSRNFTKVAWKNDGLLILFHALWPSVTTRIHFAILPPCQLYSCTVHWKNLSFPTHGFHKLRCPPILGGTRKNVKGNLVHMFWNIHSVWFIRNTSIFSICLFLNFCKICHMSVAYLFLEFLTISNKLFLKLGYVIAVKSPIYSKK